MPAPGHVPPKFGVRDVEVRAAQPVIERPKWLDGKRTYLGIGLMLLGMAGDMFGVDVPKEEINDFQAWLSAEWTTISEGLGILLAGYGRVKASKRFRKQLHKAQNIALLLLATALLPSCVVTVPFKGAARIEAKTMPPAQGALLVPVLLAACCVALGACRSAQSPSAKLFGEQSAAFDRGYEIGLWEGINIPNKQPQ